MLLSYADLQQLPRDTVNALIKEFLLMQLEDGNLEQLTAEKLQQATDEVTQQLQQGTLVVEYSEKHESVMIRRATDVV